MQNISTYLMWCKSKCTYYTYRLAKTKNCSWKKIKVYPLKHTALFLDKEQINDLDISLYMLEVKMKNTTITMLTNKHQILWKVVYIVKYFTMFLCLFCVTWCFSDNWTSMKVLQWLLVYKKQNGFRNGPLNIILLSRAT